MREKNVAYHHTCYLHTMLKYLIFGGGTPKFTENSIYFYFAEKVIDQSAWNFACRLLYVIAIKIRIFWPLCYPLQPNILQNSKVNISSENAHFHFAKIYCNATIYGKKRSNFIGEITSLRNSLCEIYDQGCISIKEM